MKMILADYILTMDKENHVVKSGALVFDTEIVAILDNQEEALKQYPQATILDAGVNSVVMPGLINAHIHLEFSKNKTTLEYGSFLPWLYSVMEHREALMQSCQEGCYEQILYALMHSGTTTIGATSSQGLDLEAAVNTPLKVVYFNELIGSNPAAADIIYGDFLKRVEDSMRLASDTFVPAIGIHSPYSVHPILVKHAIKYAKENHLRISTHFMESLAEREWLDKGSGDFKPFFKSFLGTDIPVTNAGEFLGLFKNTHTLFVHGVYTSEAELEALSQCNASIVHCPVSNRLLGAKMLDLEAVKRHKIPMLMGTDGLSSNFSTSLFDEMRATLLMHTELDLHLLSRDLLRAATTNAAKTLGVNTGELAVHKAADIITFALPQAVEEKKNIPLQIILHTKAVEHLYINGEKQPL
jgi:cytosine/adenosine deaminase-related metal-dependent hydrolase